MCLSQEIREAFARIQQKICQIDEEDNKQHRAGDRKAYAPVSFRRCFACAHRSHDISDGASDDELSELSDKATEADRPVSMCTLDRSYANAIHRARAHATELILSNALIGHSENMIFVTPNTSANLAW
jgi:hypothetical protein